MATKKAAKKVAKKAPAKKAVRKKAGGIDPNSTYGARLARRTEENLTDAMKHRRDVFIREYVRDFNGAQAWLRMKAEVDPQDAHKHYTAAQAAEHAYQLRNEPYVAKRIAELVDAMESAALLNQNRVLAMAIREAEREGMGAKHSARVSAIKLLADLLEMTSAGKTNQHNRQQGGSGAGGPAGGVMVVPEVAKSAETWEQRAARAQAELKAEVRK